jgi:tRNA (guanine37-N1)-methyltransferase
MTNNNCFEARVLTLFPEMFPGPLDYSLAGKALSKNIWKLKTVNIRDYSEDKHGKVDDEPYGGGPGMIMRADILAKAFDDNDPGKGWDRIVLTPRGIPLTQSRIRDIVSKPGVMIVCGRYEGIDERFISARSLEEVCIGDYILSGGEPAAIILIDAIVRLLLGTMGSEESLLEESFENNLLEHPQYTRPYEWEGMKPPEVLLSGNHSEIEKWRSKKSLEDTKKRRPELLFSEKK